MRPFYFSVHPDLFGKHPEERVSIELEKLLQKSRNQTFNLTSFKFKLAKKLLSNGFCLYFQEINENSLKILSAHLEALQNQKRILPGPPNLPFYLKPDRKSNQSDLKLIKIKVPLVRDTDTRNVVRNILEACHLPTEFIDKIPRRGSPRRTFTATNSTGSNASVKYKYEFDNFSSEEFDLFQLRVHRKKEEESLQ